MFLSFICANIMYSLIYNRTRDIFDIIINFPDSIGAWNDLKVPIERLPLFVSRSPLPCLCLGLLTTRRPTNSPHHFSLQSVRFFLPQSFFPPPFFSLPSSTKDTYLFTLQLSRNRKCLLRPEADMKLILSQYVTTITCLRIVDPPGVLLLKVADPI